MNYELLGIEDKNFLLNSGSYFIMLVGQMLYFLTYFLLNKCAKKLSHFKPARKLGVKVYKSSYKQAFKKGFLKLLLESYFDLMMACFLNIVAFYHSQSFKELLQFFSTPDDIANSVLTLVYFILIFAFLIYGYQGIYRNYEEIKQNDSSLTNQYSIFLENNKVKTKAQALYTVYFMGRRLAVILCLINMDNYPFF